VRQEEVTPDDFSRANRIPDQEISDEKDPEENDAWWFGWRCGSRPSPSSNYAHPAHASGYEARR
jgi:hypothetical protein